LHLSRNVLSVDAIKYAFCIAAGSTSFYDTVLNYHYFYMKFYKRTMVLIFNIVLKILSILYYITLYYRNSDDVIVCFINQTMFYAGD